MWIYLTHSKEPPLEAIEMVLSKFGSNEKHRTVRTDQDKGVSKSKDYLDLLEQLLSLLLKKQVMIIPNRIVGLNEHIVTFFK
jgi:hypothetical protein